MDILYKYSGLLPSAYFENPTIKLSVPEHLNDPFEYSTSKNILLAIKRSFIEFGVPENKADELVKDFETSLFGMISHNGIVSLTETPRNSLMWAHYASHHNGMCIGYNTELLKHIDVDNEKSECITLNHPQKVNYDNLRFSAEHEFPEPVNADRDAVIRHLLKKSDEWIYEKEHRCIIPYTKASELLIKSEDLGEIIKTIKTSGRRNVIECSPMTLESWISYYESEGIIKRKDNSNIYTINHEPHPDPNLSLESSLHVLSQSKGVNFLIKIKASSIESVYFGCKVDTNIVKSYYETIDKKIKIFHFELCKERFELIPTRVNDEYFKNKPL